MEVNLDNGGELAEAVKEWNKVSMLNNPTSDQVAQFILAYTEGRCGMIEQGLMSNTDPLAIAREVEEFKLKVAGTELLRYLLELPEFPVGMDGQTPEETKNTILGRCR